MNRNRQIDSRPVFKVTQSLMIESATYGPMFNRVYTNTMQDRDVIDDFLELTDDGRDINNINMAGLSGRIVRPSALPQHEIAIDNGFGERRIVFMIALEHTSFGSMHPKVTVLSGYTDRVDVSFGGLIAPDLKLYVNAITQINNTGKTRPTNVNHIISANSYDAFSMNGHREDAYSDQSLRLLRPMDVIRGIEHLHLEGYTNIDANNTIMPSRNQSSRRINGLSSRYLANIVNSVVASESADMFDSGMAQSRYARARASEGIKETNMIQDVVTRELKGVSTFLSDGYITWYDLNRIVPGLDDKTRVSFMKTSPDRLSREARGLDTAGWDDGTQATVAATIISQSLGAILSSCLLTYIECEFSNETVDGHTFLRIDQLASFGDFVDPDTQAQHLEFIIVNELMPILTFDGEFDISVRIEFDIQLDAFISISWDGEEWVDYNTPNFCDALLSPVITTNQDDISNMARQTSSLIDSILDRN